MNYYFSIKQNSIATISNDGMYPTGQYTVIVTIKIMCETSANSALNTLELCQSRRSAVFIVNYHWHEKISRILKTATLSRPTTTAKILLALYLLKESNKNLLGQN